MYEYGNSYGKVFELEMAVFFRIFIMTFQSQV